MIQFLHTSWPFILGLTLQGESSIILWFIQFSDQPRFWIFIMLISAVFSFSSFEFYYFMGRISPVILKRLQLHKLEKFLTRGRFVRFRWLMVISLRFLYGIRNLTALWLGTQKYPPLRYLLLNLIGDLIWISIWFLIFFLFRTLALQYYQSYIHTIRYLYLAALGVFLLWKLKKLIIDP